MMTHPLRSQELCQCFARLAAAKLRIRQWFLSLEKVRTSPNVEHALVQHFVQEHPSQQQVWFPYGRGDLQRRTIPQCGNDNERDDHTSDKKQELGVPTEVVINDDTVTVHNSDNNNYDDDMISLDDLQCCICFRGDATDENDVLLCDGQGCFRAYHMNCVSPHVSLQQVEEEENWFCPICTAIAKLLANVQSEYTGDEWRGEEDEDGATIRSWDQANDVFPEAEKEYEMAVQWKEGKHDADLVQFISTVLGIPIENGSGSNSGGDLQEGEEDDDGSEDDDFDLEAFQKQKQEEKEEGSVASSDESVQDLSSVEQIDKHELDALSVPSGDSSDEEEEVDSGRRRTRSARSSRAASANNSSAGDSSSSNRPDVGTLDESNILVGRRRRNQVDYRK